MALRTDLAPDERFLRLPEVMRLLGVSRSRVYEGMEEGVIPKQRRFGAISVWLYSEVKATMLAVINGPGVVDSGHQLSET